MRGVAIDKLLPILALLSLAACTPSAPPSDIDRLLEEALHEQKTSGQKSDQLQRLGYTIQVGAFSRIDNALRLEKRLRLKGIDAYSFLHESGLYKVRFGDHSGDAAARRQARKLSQAGVIDAFFIVPPTANAASGSKGTDPGGLRSDLVETARRFLGVPYRWGGESARNGFDCSGLTMVVYRLNGLNLPRNSAWQFGKGRPVAREDLKRGDLVFFATNGGRRVSHVGLYIGEDRFIHAPRPGRKVSIERLSSNYFTQRYVGARSYLF